MPKKTPENRIEAGAVEAPLVHGWTLKNTHFEPNTAVKNSEVDLSFQPWAVTIANTEKTLIVHSGALFVEDETALGIINHNQLMVKLLSPIMRYVSVAPVGVAGWLRTGAVDRDGVDLWVAVWID